MHTASGWQGHRPAVEFAPATSVAPVAEVLLEFEGLASAVCLGEVGCVVGPRS